MPRKETLTIPPSQDPLSLVHDRPSQTKSRSKSHGSADEHFSSLFRMGRVVASIFDRGRHMKYDYHITQPEPSSRRLASAPNTHTASIINSSAHTSRSSSISVTSTSNSNDRKRLSVPLSTPGSRRGSSESSQGPRTRRGGMSVA